MVRYKHRYFLVEVERAKNVANGTLDVTPLSATEAEVSQTIKDVVGDLHGDFGRSSISSGFRVKYLNPATRVLLLRCRHGGPDKILSSSLPFLNNIKSEGVVCRLLYTGATIRHSYMFLEKRQKKLLSQIVKVLGEKGKYNKDELHQAVMQVNRFEKQF